MDAVVSSDGFCSAEGRAAAPRAQAAQDRAFVGVTRAAAGLPEGAVVFACFNTLIKLRPKILRAWADVLRRVPGSVLWLLRAPRAAERNVAAAWAAAGGDPAALLFGDPANKEDHLRRAGLADLFLDSDLSAAPPRPAPPRAPAPPRPAQLRPALCRPARPLPALIATPSARRYGAHSTGTDALWGGLPLIVRPAPPRLPAAARASLAAARAP
jgi:hypothetical protein